MMISDGSGMHADSIAIRTTMPRYPPPEITAMMKPLSAVMILAVMARIGCRGSGFPVRSCLRDLVGPHRLRDIFFAGGAHRGGALVLHLLAVHHHGAARNVILLRLV